MKEIISIKNEKLSLYSKNSFYIFPSLEPGT